MTEKGKVKQFTGGGRGKTINDTNQKHRKSTRKKMTRAFLCRGGPRSIPGGKRGGGGEESTETPEGEGNSQKKGFFQTRNKERGERTHIPERGDAGGPIGGKNDPTSISIVSSSRRKIYQFGRKERASPLGGSMDTEEDSRKTLLKEKSNGQRG